MLPRDDFDPWYFRPFENFFKSRGIVPGVGPLGRNRNNIVLGRNNKENAPRAHESGRSHHSPAVLFIERVFSDVLKNVEDCIIYVNKGIL